MSIYSFRSDLTKMVSKMFHSQTLESQNFMNGESPFLPGKSKSCSMSIKSSGNIINRQKPCGESFPFSYRSSDQKHPQSHAGFFVAPVQCICTGSTHMGLMARSWWRQVIVGLSPMLKRKNHLFWLLGWFSGVCLRIKKHGNLSKKGLHHSCTCKNFPLSPQKVILELAVSSPSATTRESTWCASAVSMLVMA